MLKILLADVTQIPEYFQKEHFPSLNGFRAISVIIVIVFHLELSNGYIYQIIFNGSLGVNVFFVLSGFLITSLLLKEKVATGTISLRSFYIRRALRILPAAYLCIIIVGLLSYFYNFNTNYTYLVAAALFVVNFEFLSNIKSAFISHYWSLSVEEQFYLLFPVIVKKNFKLFVLFLLFIVCILPFLFTIQYFFPATNSRVFFGLTHFLIKFQGIAVGCLFAVLCFKNILKPARYKHRVFLKIIITIAIFGIVHTAAINVISVYTNLIVSLLIGWLLILNFFQSDDAYFKVLNLPFLSRIGILSYSIYIWHLLVFKLTINSGHFATYPLSLFILFSISIASYNYWEKPFLQLKSKFSIMKSSADRKL